MSVKQLKNSQQMDYATDHGNSYVDREREKLLKFLFKKKPAHIVALFAARTHRYCGSGRPWYADTRVERDGLSHR